MYRTDITQSVEPAMANPNTLAKVSEAQAAQVRSETAMQETFSKVGADIFSGVYKAYDTQQKEKKVKALGEQIGVEVTDLQTQLDDIIASDTAYKTQAELERAQMIGNEDEIRAGAMLAGADPVIANQVANVFTTENENKFISNFREEQQRIMLARDAMPQRQHEMMLRSEALLKKAIAETPELANNFRQIAEQVTGKARVDLYSVNKLYEDINFIERQKQEAGKAAQKQEDMMRTAYVNDRKQAGGISETQALLEWQQKSPKEKYDLAQASVAYAQSSKDADAALKAGGDALTNLTTLAKISFENELMGDNAHVLSQLKILGVSPQQIASGTVPPEIANSTEYKKLIETGGSKILMTLDAQYKTMNDKLMEKMKTVPADAAKARQAQEDLKKWYDDTKKYYTENKTSWLVATTTNPDGLATLQKRLNVVNSLVQSLSLPPDVIASLGMTGDKQAYNDARARYPKTAKALDHFAMLREKAMQGVPDTEWMQLMKDIDSFNGEKQGTAPTTLTEAVASCVTYEQCNDITRKAATDKNVVVEDPIAHVNKQVQLAFADPANTERLLKGGIASINEFINTRVQPADKPNIVNLINMAAENNVYGALGHGDKAKASFTEALAYYDRYKDIGITITFKDVTGASALLVAPTRPMSNVPQNKLSVLQDWQRAGSRPPSSMGQLQSRLSAVDDVLKLQSQLTGVSIFELRKNFIKTFTSQGSVSEAYGAQTQAMVSGETPAAVVAPESVVPASELGSQQFPMTPAPAASATTSDFTGAAPIPASALANQEAMRLAEEKANAAKPSREATGKLIDETKRPDGTNKGTGYLGVLKASDGSDVTEFSMSSSDVKVKGKEIDFPTIVPTLTKAEVNLMLTDIIPNNKRIPDAIYKKAVDHAKKRIKEGKSVFAETGDYKPADIIAPKKNPLSGKRPDLQPDAAPAISNSVKPISADEVFKQLNKPLK
jgi:hypothetical protein